MVPANSVDMARIRKLLDVADEHLKESELNIYMDKDYTHIEIRIRNAPEAKDVLELPLDELLVGH